MGYILEPVHCRTNSGSGSNGLPAVKKSDNGKVLTVKNGKWAAQKPQSADDLAKVAKTGSYTDLKNKPDLSGYATKEEVAADKEELMAAIGNIVTLSIEMVAELPAEGANGTIYLVPNQSSEEKNLYDEFLFLNNDWELIGSTKLEIPENVSAFNNDAGYITSSDIPEIPEIPENVSSFNNDAGYITGVAWNEINGAPENVSEFQNDSAFVNMAQVEAFIKSRVKGSDSAAAAMGYMTRVGDELYDNVVDVMAASEPNVPVEMALTDDIPDGDALLLMTADGDEDKDITIDLNGHEYNAVSAGGSAGTQTQAVHLEKGNTVVIKGGTLSAALENPNIKMLIQNYADLTLEDMTIDCSDNPNIQYVVSNNFGHCTIKNCTITASDHVTAWNKPGVAVDCWFGLANDGSYDNGVRVDIIDSVINGTIEYGAQRAALNRAGNEEWWTKAILNIENSEINGSIVNSGAGTNDQHSIYIDGVEVGFIEG